MQREYIFDVLRATHTIPADKLLIGKLNGHKETTFAFCVTIVSKFQAPELKVAWRNQRKPSESERQLKKNGITIRKLTDEFR